MKIYGLTGGIASGKSTVASILKEELDVPIIDADLLARQAVDIGSTGLEAVVTAFGTDILFPDGSLNRKKLGDRVFGDRESIKKLNDIIHPEVDRLFMELVEKHHNQGCKAVVYDCPLLIEENLMNRVDEIILVITSKNLQLERLMRRNSFTYEESLQRINMQMKMEEKMIHADYIIYNDGNYDELKESVIHLWEWLENTKNSK